MDVQELIDLHPGQKKRLLKLEHDLKLAQMRQELKDHPAMQELTKTLVQTIIACNSVLLHNKDIAEVERRVVMAERDVYQWFLRVLDSSEQIKKIETYFDKLYGQRGN